ncbi:MAG: hypothetical protein WBX25_15140 [Rhodomicrobium sp.]
MMSRPSKKLRARAWIELAIATGHDPYMILRQTGWGLQLRAPNHSGQPITSKEELPPFPDDLWDEALEICESLNRVHRFEKTEAATIYSR